MALFLKNKMDLPTPQTREQVLALLNQCGKLSYDEMVAFINSIVFILDGGSPVGSTLKFKGLWSNDDALLDVYDIDTYVSYNGLIYRSAINNNHAIPGVDGSWAQQSQSVTAALGFKGYAVPATNPGAPVAPEYWIGGPGTYTNFGGQIVTGALGFLIFNGSTWSVANVAIDLTSYYTKTQSDTNFINKVTEIVLGSAVDDPANFVVRANIQKGWWNSTNGNLTSSTNNWISYPEIAVTPGQIIRIKNTLLGSGLSLVAFKNSAHSYVSGLTANGTNSQDITVPAGVAYACINIAALTDVAINPNPQDNPQAMAVFMGFVAPVSAILQILSKKIIASYLADGIKYNGPITDPKHLVTLEKLLANESVIYTSIAALQATIDGVAAGGTVDAMPAPPYVVKGALGFTQSAAASGFAFTNTSGSSSSIGVIETLHTWNINRVTRIQFKVVSMGTTPAIGLGFGDLAGTFKAGIYRSSGQTFGVAATAGVTGLTPSWLVGERAATPVFTYVVNDIIRMDYDIPNLRFRTQKNDDTWGAWQPLNEVPTGAISIAMRGVISVSQFKIIELNPVAETATSVTYHVKKTGLDTNTGTTAGNPFLTIGKALSLTQAGNGGRIFVYDGDYRETLNTDIDKDIEIIFVGSARVLGSDTLTGWTKTAGQTYVYQIPFSGTIVTPGLAGVARRLYEDKRYSLDIGADKRHPYMRGLGKFLPFTIINEVASLALCDSTAASFYLDTAGGVLYIHNGDGTNPATSNYPIENSARAVNTSSNTIKYIRLRMRNFKSFYSSAYGFLSYGQQIDRINCTVFGARQEGFRDDICVGSSEYDEAAGCCNDGANGHYLAVPDVNDADLRIGRYMVTYKYPWYHDNRGDGLSHHERSDLNVLEPLCERNGRAGIVPFAGGGCVVTGGILRDNEGWGCYAAGATTDGRVNSTLVLNGTVITGNYTNVYAANSARITLINCVVRGATYKDLYAATNGVILSKNTRWYNADTSKQKLEETGGQVIPENEVTYI
jgi:hypothetical protein